eukprot:scaffold6117_cov64-Phaeocystis_antarctica.AAC.3
MPPRPAARTAPRAPTPPRGLRRARRGGRAAAGANLRRPSSSERGTRRVGQLSRGERKSRWASVRGVPSPWSCCWAASEPMQPTPLLLSAEEGGRDRMCRVS